MKHLTSHRQSWFYLGIALASTLLISCGQSEDAKPKEAWLPDTKVVWVRFWLTVDERFCAFRPKGLCGRRDHSVY